MLLAWGYQYFSAKLQIRANAELKARDETKRAAEKLAKPFRVVQQAGQDLADDLSSGDLPYHGLEERMRSDVERGLDVEGFPKFDPSLFGISAAFKPDKFKRGVRLHAPYYKKIDGTIVADTIEANYDYTNATSAQANTDWYHLTLQENEGSWKEPYYGAATNKFVAEYSTPFYPPSNETEPDGVVTSLVSLEDVSWVLQSLDLGAIGYGFILSDAGTLLAYPVAEFIGSKIQTAIPTVGEKPEENKAFHDALAAARGAATSGKPGVANFHNEKTGQDAWVCFAKIQFNDEDSDTGQNRMFELPFSLVVVHFRDDIAESLYDINPEFSSLVLILSLLLSMAVGSLLCFAIDDTLKLLWGLSICVSTFLLAGVALIWFVELRSPLDQDSRFVQLLTRSSTAAFLERQRECDSNSSHEPPTYIPTGIFIQSAEFSGANDLSITGYIWQRYHNDQIGKPDQIENPDQTRIIRQGFVLPESESLDVQEAYQRPDGKDHTVYGWRVEAQIREVFDYARYPLDNQNVWVRIWHQDFDRNIILVPDLDSYDSTNPFLLPGVPKDFFLNGWDVEKSYFGYRLNSYNSNFGIKNYVGQHSFPELYFNVVVRRVFVGPFVTHIIPLIVVAFLLFAILMVATRDPQLNEVIGFTSLAAVEGAAAIFFVAILSHIDLRNQIQGVEILYVEYFYFVLYISVIAVAIDCIIFSKYLESRLFQYQDNLVPKLLYWPLLASLALAITLVRFNIPDYPPSEDSTLTNPCLVAASSTLDSQANN